jgi:hypothetical protein
LWTVIRSIVEPLPAKSLAKLLVAPWQIAERHLAPILDEYVASGKLRVFPAKTAKGKLRYWDRDAAAISRAAALEAMQRADEPFTARELISRLIVPLKFTEEEFAEILNESVSAGTLHVFPPKSAKSKPRYWNCDPLEFGRLAILKTLDARGPQSAAKLKKSVKGLSEVEFQQILQSAIASGDVWRHPALGKSNKELVGRRPPSPEPYLRDVGNQLATIVAQLLSANVPQSDLRRALVQLVETAGVPFSAAATSKSESPPAAPLAAVDLVGLMKRIEPGADRGALVGSRDLRRVAQFVEKPPPAGESANPAGQAATPRWTSAGVYLFSQSLLRQIALIRVGSLERDVLESLPAGTVQAFKAPGGFLDIGTPESYATRRGHDREGVSHFGQ